VAEIKCVVNVAFGGEHRSRLRVAAYLAVRRRNAGMLKSSSGLSSRSSAVWLLRRQSSAPAALRGPRAKQSEKVILMSRKNSASPAYGQRLNIPVTTLLAAAVASAAAKQLTSMNSYVRGAVLAKLQSDGIEIEEVQRRAG
jgi:hypothetical protein